MESEWHREVVRVWLQSTAFRAALRQLPGKGLPLATHWLTTDHRDYFAYSISTVGDTPIFTSLGVVTGWAGVKPITVPDRPVTPI